MSPAQSLQSKATSILVYLFSYIAAGTALESTFIHVSISELAHSLQYFTHARMRFRSLAFKLFATVNRSGNVSRGGGDDGSITQPIPVKPNLYCVLQEVIAVLCFPVCESDYPFDDPKMNDTKKNVTIFFLLCFKTFQYIKQNNLKSIRNIRKSVK